MRAVHPAPISGRPWKFALQNRAANQFAKEFVPEGDIVELANEHLTVEILDDAQMIRAEDIRAMLDAEIRPRITDGRLAITADNLTPATMMTCWVIEGDVLLEDQFEFQWISQAGQSIHIRRYFARGAPTPERLEAGRRLVIDADIDWNAHAHARQSATPLEIPSRARLFEALGRLQDAFERARVPARELYREIMSVARRDVVPEAWGLFSAGFGVQLLDHTAKEERQDLELALHALRSSLEVAQTKSEQWATRALHIGDAYEALAETAKAEQAFGVARETFLTIGDGARAGDALARIASMRLRNAGEDRGRLAGTVALARQALAGVTAASDPIQWARRTLLLGDVHLALSKFDEPGEEAAAEAAFREVVDVLSRTRFDEPNHKATALLAFASNRLLDMDRTSIPEPVWTVGEPPSPDRSVVFLRPLETAGRLLVRNEFRDQASFRFRFDVNPDTITIEMVLTFALFEKYRVQAIGGRPEAFGTSRVMSIGDVWREAFGLSVEMATLVLIVPSASEGMRWELNELQRRGLLAKCLFVQPPDSTEFDVRALWAGASDALRHVGVEVPPFDERGLLFRVDPSGKTAETFPFALVWENQLADRVVRAFGASPTPPEDPRMSGHWGAMIKMPLDALCPVCGEALIVPALLFADVEGPLPLELIEGRQTEHECPHCRSVNPVPAPLLAIDHRQAPHLIYVPIEFASQDTSDEWLKYILGLLRELQPTEWSHAWIKDIKVMGRTEFGAWLRTRRGQTSS